MVKVTGVVGPAGTASHEAAAKIGIKDVKFFRNIPHVFSALEVEEVQQAIVPIENVIRGTIGGTVDELYDIEPTITGEVLIPIKLCIACLKTTKKEQIKRILSDQKAIAQSLVYLNKKFPDPELENVASAANAMKMIAEEKLSDSAAIGSEFAATHYGLKILDNDIEDRKGNITRYIVIEMEGETKPTGKDKTAIFVLPKSPEDRPGILYEILGCFASRKINLTNLELRPSIEKFGYYNFFVEFEGHQKNSIVKEALSELKKFADFKVLGSFPKA